MRKFSVIAILISILVLFSGCGNEETSAESDKVTIYTTVYPLQFITEEIGGEYVEVETIYPAGVDEHSFEPTQKDMVNVAESDYFFYIGYGLEAFVPSMEEALKAEDVAFVAIGEMLEIEPIEYDEHEEHSDEDHEEEHDDGHNHSDEGGVNPHVWLNPLYCDEMARFVTDILSAEKPEEAEYFETNYEELSAQFVALNNAFIEVTSNAKHDEFVVSHEAFSYWETSYGIHQVGIQGVSTSSEPTQKELIQLIEEIEADGIHYILLEQNVSDTYVEVIESETDVEVLPIHNLSVLTSEDIKNGEDYFSLMYKNLESLDKALNY